MTMSYRKRQTIVVSVISALLGAPIGFALIQGLWWLAMLLGTVYLAWLFYDLSLAGYYRRVEAERRYNAKHGLKARDD